MPTTTKGCFPCIKGDAAKYQDQKYGRNIRVHNLFNNKSGNPVTRCTVCGKETLA